MVVAVFLFLRIPCRAPKPVPVFRTRLRWRLGALRRWSGRVLEGGTDYWFEVGLVEEPFGLVSPRRAGGRGRVGFETYGGIDHFDVGDGEVK